MRIELDMYQTMAVAVLALMLGRYLRKKCWLLERFCIPAPVIGGVIFAVATCICYVTGIAEFVFDDILKEVFMVFFFTSVGFQANLKVLKSGGKSMIIFLGLVIGLIVLQNGTAVGLAKFLHLDPLVGMCTGSIPMTGGHGTAGAFGPVLEDFGISGATTVCTAAATFVLTLACGKYRFNDLDLGEINGIPRILDMGQCNDAYSAIYVAQALAEIFGCGINELPLTLVLSWYEQKAVCILLTLLALGVKNIYLGPTLPAFLSESVVQLLVHRYSLTPITAAPQDLDAILGRG